ncbi:hypothetical protein HOLleu_44835 [Holothuria leucospilota]|uniref:C2H2-type domain-containing protein n=1 Tax=Holothuria leucospilota TaxID=206669 RepID=A0A9Q0YCV0_HOLLE|nr:hypothetical protein HOLleu_44835 [Holothuria leucospilota]
MCDFITKRFQKLIKHYRFGHSSDPRFNIVCGVDGCAKNYSNIQAYRRHIKAKHEQFWLSIQNIPNLIHGAHNDAPAPLDELEEDVEEQPDVDVEVSSFLLKLREIHKTSQSSCSFVANEFVEMLKDHRESLKQEVYGTLQRSGVNVEQLEEGGLAESFQESDLERAFTHFAQPKNLHKFVSDSYGLVQPQEFVLGHDAVDGKPHTMQYVPILETLRTLLGFDDVLAEVLGGHRSAPDVVADYCDGFNFSKNVFFSNDPSSLQIQLYFDDFTVANPLGTHVQMLKFSAMYFVLGNLHPRHRSNLRMIQLVSLCPSSYVKKYGLAEMLYPLLEDLKTLKQEGVTILKDGAEHTFHGSVSFISADNLAAHEVGGFQTHFHHGRICRMCNVTTAELKNHFSSDGLIMRSEEVYDQQAEMIQENPALSGTYGVKSKSAFNDLQYFHVASGLPPDIAHDLFEGVIPETICKVVKALVDQDYFTLAYLNKRIRHFPYEGSDRTNKPSTMSEMIHSFKVKQTACQAWCLLRLLPLMVGHLVPQECAEWKVLLCLLNVTEYCTTPVVTAALAKFLGELIEEFLRLYYEVFPNQSMKPKFHYLIHYPDMMLCFGPLVHNWTLRFEGKHNYFKEISRPTKNRINLCKTLAERHEHMQACFRTRSTFLNDEFISHSNSDMYPVRLLPHDIQGQLLPLAGQTESVYSAKSASYNGVQYFEGLAVVMAPGYSFAVIDMCFIVGHELFLLCKLAETMDYVPHFHAYSVEQGRKVVLLSPNELHDHYPLGVYEAGNVHLIPMRHYVMNKRTDIIGPASGVGKSKILTALLKTFGQNELDGDIQVYDKDFDDYADIEECDLVTGPAKVRLTTTPQQDAVQVLPVMLGMADNVTTICTG